MIGIIPCIYIVHGPYYGFIYIYIIHVYIGTIIAHKKDCIHEAFVLPFLAAATQDISNMLQVARRGTPWERWLHFIRVQQVKMPSRY